MLCISWKMCILKIQLKYYIFKTFILKQWKTCIALTLTQSTFTPLKYNFKFNISADPFCLRVYYS